VERDSAIALEELPGLDVLSDNRASSRRTESESATLIPTWSEEEGETSGRATSVKSKSSASVRCRQPSLSGSPSQSKPKNVS
jgi:hypothetical protein